MKKFLSLVLALVMTMSLVTISAGAKDFADADDITYVEAVDVLSTLGVLLGDETGFRPTDTLKRSEAAKIICALNLTPKTADTLTADTAPFADVPASHWAAGFIAEGVQSGIIAGKGDNKFDPDGKLTGYEFLKMLLVSLGYDAAIEGMTGANWSINVAKLADELELTKGNDDFVGSAAITREEAALYALNTLKADMVDYADKGTQITINGVVIATGASKSSVVTGTATKYGNVYDEVKGGASKYTVQLGEKVFSKLQLTNAGGTGDFGRPTNTWKYDGKKIGSYDAKDPVLTYTAGLKEKALFTDLGVDGFDSDGTAKYVMLDVYVDGAYQGTAKAHKGQDVTMTGTGNGTTVEIYKTSTNNYYTMVIINEYITKVSLVTKADEDKGEKRYVTTSYGTFETEEFAKNDWVLVTVEKSDSNNHVVKSMALAEKVEDAAVTAYKTTENVTFDGSTYKYSANYTGAYQDNYNMKSGNTYTFYLDSNGYVIKDTTYTATNTDYSYVISAVDKGTGDFSTDNYHKYQVVNTEGVVSVIQAYDKNGTAAPGDIITYSEDKDNNGYVKVEQVNATDDGEKSYQVKSSSAVSTLKSTVASVGGLKVNNSTTFVLKTGSNKWKVVEGLANVGSYASFTNTVYAYAVMNKSDVAEVLFLDATSASVTSIDAEDLVYIVNTTPTKTYDADNEYYVYSYAAIVEGESTTITANSASVVTGKGLYEITETVDGYVSKLTAKTTNGYDAARASGVKVEYEDGVLSIAGGTSYVVADDVTVITIDKSDKVNAEAAIENVTGDVVTGNFAFVMKTKDNATVVTIYFQGTVK